MSLLLLIETLFAAVQARTVEDIYISHRNYPGGPWAYFLHTQYLPVNVIFYSTLFLLTFLSDLLVVCPVTFMPSKPDFLTPSTIIVMALLGYLVWFRQEGGIPCHNISVIGAFGVIWYESFIFRCRHSANNFGVVCIALGTIWTLQSSKPGLSLYSSVPVAFGTAYYMVSLSVNIVLTILITIRLYLYRRRVNKTLNPDYGTQYFSLATIIIESAASYSICAIIFIVTYAVGHPINQIALAVASNMQVSP